MAGRMIEEGCLRGIYTGRGTMEQLFEGEEGSAWSGKSRRSSFSFFLVRYCVSRVDVGVDIVRLRDSLGMELLFLRHNTIRLILSSLSVCWFERVGLGNIYLASE